MSESRLNRRELIRVGDGFILVAAKYAVRETVPRPADTELRRELE